MYYKKKTARLVIIYSLAAVLVMGGFLAISTSQRDQLRRSVAIGFDNAFLELDTAVSSLDTSLKKTLCASTPSMVSDLCAQGYAHSLAASQAIASLPYGNIELEHTAAFLAKTGDYMLYLSRMCSRGHRLTQEERQSLLTLSDSASQVSGALSDLTARLLSGQISTDELEDAESRIAGAEDNLVDTGFAQSFKNMETDLPEMPSLIYDGPFSQHILDMDPRALEGLSEIDEEAAKSAAAKFLGLERPDLEVTAFREGEIPVYVLTRQNGSEVETLEVTKKGGRVIFYGTVREPSEGSVSPEGAVKTAGRFLESHGFESMTPTYYTAEGGELIANFAFQQDGVICYPDLIKVSVALDTGRVCGMEAAGYYTCHTLRQLSPAAFDTQEAAKNISPYLTVRSHRPALIPTDGKNELLCEEYLCDTPDGRRVLVYLDASTAREEKILLLLDSDSGTLTL